MEEFKQVMSSQNDAHSTIRLSFKSVFVYFVWLALISVFGASNATANPLPVEWKKALVAIELPTPIAQRMAGAPPYMAIGTGFFVTPDSHPPLRGVLFTADHVFSKACEASDFVYLRHESSPKTPGGEPIRYRLHICDRRIASPTQPAGPSQSNLNVMVSHAWIKHPRLDLAAVLCPPSPEMPTDIVSFAINEIATSDDLKKWGIGEADETYTVSFHPNVVQASPSSAIVRHGTISEFNADPDTFLIDSLVFPGDSGSPVVLRPVGVHFMNGSWNWGQVNPPLLLGVVVEYLPYVDVAISAQTSHPRITFEENSGLVKVIRSQYVLELLDLIKPTIGPAQTTPSTTQRAPR